jgi:regulator of replication initiation timing
LADVEANAKEQQALLESQMAGYRTEADALRRQINSYADQTNAMQEEVSKLKAKLSNADYRGTEAESLRKQIQRYEEEASLMRTNVSRLIGKLSRAEEKVDERAKEMEEDDRDDDHYEWVGSLSSSAKTHQFKCRCGGKFNAKLKHLSSTGHTCPHCRRIKYAKHFWRTVSCSWCDRTYDAIEGLESFQCKCGKLNKATPKRYYREQT